MRHPFPKEFKIQTPLSTRSYQRSLLWVFFFFINTIGLLSMTSLRKLCFQWNREKGILTTTMRCFFLFNFSLSSKILSGIYVTENRPHLLEIFFPFYSPVSRNESITIFFFLQRFRFSVIQ